KNRFMSEKNKDSKKNKASKKGRGQSPKFPNWIYAVLLLALIGFQFYFMSSDGGNRIKYSTFLEYVEEGYVSQITIKNGSHIRGEYTRKALTDSIVTPAKEEDDGWQLGEASNKNTFTTTMLEGDEIRPILDRNNVTYDVRIEEDWFSGILIWLIPIGLAVIFWIFIFRRMNPGQQV